MYMMYCIYSIKFEKFKNSRVVKILRDQVRHCGQHRLYRGGLKFDDRLILPEKKEQPLGFIKYFYH